MDKELDGENQDIKDRKSNEVLSFVQLSKVKSAYISYIVVVPYTAYLCCPLQREFGRDTLLCAFAQDQ